MIIRVEQENDYKKVENVIREAFWNLFTQGCTEHYLMHILREDSSFIKELSLVAEEKGEIIGQISYSRGNVKNEDETNSETIIFGPVSVDPRHQYKGVGKQLIEKSFDIAKNMGFTRILIYGDPSYYSKYGFVRASQFKISRSDGLFAPSLMGIELEKDAFRGVSGRFFEADVYAQSELMPDEYDKEFPYKEKLETESQKEFLRLSTIIEEL